MAIGRSGRAAKRTIFTSAKMLVWHGNEERVYRSFAFIAVTALGLLAGGCTGKVDSHSAAEQPRRVQVVKAEKRKIPRIVVAVGTLAAEDRAEIGFKVAGRLDRWNVDLGSQVTGASVLAELDARDYELR